MHLPVPPPRPTSSNFSNTAQLLLRPISAVPNHFLTALSIFFIFSTKQPHHLHLQSPRSVSFSNSCHHRQNLGSGRKFLRLTAPSMTQNPKNPFNPNLISHPFPTPQSLSDWLRPRLPSDSFASWGIKPGTKNVHNLWLEIADGETSLIDTTPPVRNLEVVSVRVLRVGVNHNVNSSSGTSNLVLIESHQELSDGTIRERGRPLSEKMKAGEDVESAARRAIKEELGSILMGKEAAGSVETSEKRLELDRIVKILPDSYRKTVEQGVSKSYPGLPACYVMHTVDAFVEGLPEEEEFVTIEGNEYGDDCCGDQKSIVQEAVSCKKHFWRWVYVE